ncbi:TetR family transcriptional regulator [Microbispora corallina]|uniref:TetR family transcriptional regulator n=1 Tax=Microbispora corallina TaxID=83302 RepID=A0ABQ4FWA9_9ACTN|nr:TetR/AcrR family transcriptional regulator [Microbispora corallina]GIH39075.1 TetR family transcriptional regulator [Microbispora corallina]
MAEPRRRAGRDAAETRGRILAVAQSLFAERGYAGTSVADIAGRLGTSKAALYYHFSSKSEIAQALLAGPLEAYERLTAGAAGRPAEDLLAAVIETTEELHELVGVIGGDPSLQSARGALVSRSREINESVVAALAGEGPGRAGEVRAQAAYAVAKNGTLALLASGGGRLSPSDRAELLAAAVRALTADS